MICKEDVVTWFKNLKSYKRIDLMCCLLNCCLPHEVRFLGTCVENLGRRDYQELRPAENEANGPPNEINSFANADLLDEQVRTKLAIYLSVLYSNNYLASTTIFKALTKSDDLLRLVQNSVAIGDSTILEELLLIFTEAVNHPAFSIEQKLILEKHLDDLCVEDIRNSEGQQSIKHYQHDNDKTTTTIQGYPLGCISVEDGQFISVSGAPLPNIATALHPPGEQGTVMSLHDGGGNGAAVRLGCHGVGLPVLPPGTTGWTVVSHPPPPPIPQPLGPQGDSPITSRTSSPISRPGSPSITTNQHSKSKFPRVPSDIFRDTIGKEMPKYVTNLQNYTNEQLARMSDDELREIGLTQSAILQLRNILTKQVVTNGIGPPDIQGKKKPDEPENIIRRYPLEGMAVYPLPPGSVPSMMCHQPSTTCFSCYAVPRKVPIHTYHQAAPGTLPLVNPVIPSQVVQPQLHHSNIPIGDMKNLRLEEQNSSSESASDNSPPDTPAPLGAPSLDCLHSSDERLGSGNGGGTEEKRGGGARSRGMGRNRPNPPGIQTLSRGRGPNPTHRRRDNVSLNMANGGIDERKIYQNQNSGNNNSIGDPPGATQSYFTTAAGYMWRPAAYTYHPAATFVRHAYPTAYHNGTDIVYQYPPPHPPSTGGTGSYLSPPPPPPQSYSPLAPQLGPRQQQNVLKPLSCYNCGNQNHSAVDCPERTIDELSKQGYKIDFSTPYQKPPGDIPGTTDK